MVGDERSFGVVVGLSLLIAGLASYGHRTERRPLVVVAGVLMALQVVGHLIRVDTARAFISFFGDGASNIGAFHEPAKDLAALGPRRHRRLCPRRRLERVVGRPR